MMKVTIKRVIFFMILIGLVSVYSSETRDDLYLISLNGGKGTVPPPVVHPSLYKIRNENNHERHQISANDKVEFLKNLKKFSDTYKDGLPEERSGITYFKGKAKCITCHNSLYIYRTNDYLSKLNDYYRTGSEIKLEFDPDKLAEKTVSDFKLNDAIELLDFLKDESDIKWSGMNIIPSA